MIVEAIERGEYLWLLAKVVKYVALYLHIDYEAKTWKLTSERMFDPSFQRVNFYDIDDLFKAKPSGYKVEEKRTPAGKFESYTVSTW